MFQGALSRCRGVNEWLKEGGAVSGCECRISFRIETWLDVIPRPALVSRGYYKVSERWPSRRSSPALAPGAHVYCFATSPQ